MSHIIINETGVEVITVGIQGPTILSGEGGGATDHGALTGLGDDDHTQYLTNTRGDARYYTQSQLNGGQLDSRYFTETEVTTALAGKANSSHTHTSSQITDFQEAVEDVVGAQITAGTNVTVNYNDTTGKVTINATGGGGGGDMYIATYDAAGITQQMVGTTATQTITNKTLTSPILNGTLSGTGIKDEDNFASNSDTAVPTQQSVKAYVDSGLSGKANSSHSHATSDITSGTFADARISSSSVTQHAPAKVSSTTDNTIVRFDGTSGAQQTSGVTIGDNNELSQFRGEFNNQTGTTYTLASGDCGKVVTLSNASAITLTLPGSLAVGFNCRLVQLGAGQVTISAGSGATLHHRQSHTKIAGQYGEASLIVKTNSGGSAAIYNLAGDTSA